MHIKYQRTSTDQQHGNRFSTDTVKYDKVFFDKGISGTRPFKDRTEAKKVVELVNAGKVNTLTVPELRDIGRNTVDSINTIAFLDEHDVNVEVLSMGITSKVNDKPNPIWKLVTAVMSALYDLELDNLKLRTKMGRDAYLKAGGKLGRRKGDTESIATFLEKPKTKKIISLIDQGKSVRDIAGRLSVSSSLVVKVRKHYLNS
jgi:DNA invertase Pin-like site-specific DNA recombinase